MVKYILRRVLGLVPVLVFVTLLVFSMLLLVPGDAVSALLGPQATPAEIEQLRVELGLELPVAVQYFRWLTRALRGDLGRSIVLGRPVSQLLWSGFRNTAILAVSALLIASVGGIVVGVACALRPRSILDRASMMFMLIGNSMPTFWFGLLLISAFSVRLGWLPVSGMYSVRTGPTVASIARHLVLPAVTLAGVNVAYICRMTRSLMLETLRQDYTRTARAKGLPHRVVIFKHAFRNALPQVVTLIGLRLGYLLAGSVVTEAVFNWPGIGWTMYKAIAERDLPVIQGGVALIGFAFVAVNLIVDIACGLLDPRISYS